LDAYSIRRLLGAIARDTFGWAVPTLLTSVTVAAGGVLRGISTVEETAGGDWITRGSWRDEPGAVSAGETRSRLRGEDRGLFTLWSGTKKASVVVWSPCELAGYGLLVLEPSQGSDKHGLGSSLGAGDGRTGSAVAVLEILQARTWSAGKTNMSVGKRLTRDGLGPR
jgi:hypothetical protein